MFALIAEVQFILYKDSAFARAMEIAQIAAPQFMFWRNSLIQLGYDDV